MADGRSYEVGDRKPPKPTAETARMAREGKERLDGEMQKDRELARRDPMAVTEALYEELAAMQLRWARSINKAKKRASRDFVDVQRELRQTIDKLLEYRRARGQDAEASEWLADMDARLEAAPAALEAGLRPAVEVVS